MINYVRHLFVLILISAVIIPPVYAAGTGSEQLNEELDRIEKTMEEAFQLAQSGQTEQASRQVFEAFMAFEESRLHSRLAAVEPGLYKKIESNYLAYRSAIKAQSPPEQIKTRLAAIQETHGAIRESLNIERTSFWTLFVSSFMIIFREGLEALLVIAAMLAYLAKVNASEQKSALYWGTGVALVFSVLLWIASNWLFSISGAQQELLEGVTMLIATGVLFWVSYWLISKAEAAKWKAFIESNIDRSLEAGSSLMLGLVAFIVVFREGFETVLFYQALTMTSGTSLLGGGGIMVGLLIGIVALFVIGYFIIKSGKRIPLRPFFIGTSIFLYALAFKFAGDGIVELQEAGVLDVEMAPFIPDAVWLQSFFGIYPMWKPLVLQSILIVFFLFGLAYTFGFKPAAPARASR